MMRIITVKEYLALFHVNIQWKNVEHAQNTGCLHWGITIKLKKYHVHLNNHTYKLWLLFSYFIWQHIIYSLVLLLLSLLMAWFIFLTLSFSIQFIKECIHSNSMRQKLCCWHNPQGWVSLGTHTIMKENTEHT